MGVQQEAKAAVPQSSHVDGETSTESAAHAQFAAGAIPGVSRKGDAAADAERKSASDQAYKRVLDPHAADAEHKRSRAQLGPEEQGDFGKPYENFAQALAAETFLRVTLLPAVLAKFGPEVHGLWASYLNRNPGDNLKPRIFEGKSRVADAFMRCSETAWEQSSLLSETATQLLADWDTRVAKLPLNQWVVIPLGDLGAAERQLQTNFGNPDNIPGHIAGGAGASDAGPDTRKVAGNVRVKRTSDDAALVEPDFHFTVNDAVDFIPGNVGTGAESNFTIPLSRLEASGWAYDVPFEVRFHGPVSAPLAINRVTGGDLPPLGLEEPGRGDQIRGNTGTIPDHPTPGAKTPAQATEEREKTVGKVTGKKR